MVDYQGHEVSCGLPGARDSGLGSYWWVARGRVLKSGSPGLAGGRASGQGPGAGGQNPSPMRSVGGEESEAETLGLGRVKE